jgi:1-deoxy-D-xylulose-5-phosphate reductoisomerase
LSFEQADLETFRNLDLAFWALQKGGNMPCILNAANEIAVSLFLKEQISFLGMSDLIEGVMNKTTFIEKPVLEDYIGSDKEARSLAQEWKG